MMMVGNILKKFVAKISILSLYNETIQKYKYYNVFSLSQNTKSISNMVLTWCSSVDQDLQGYSPQPGLLPY